MQSLLTQSKNDLTKFLNEQKEKYEEYKAKNLKLDMSRGKPGKEQLDLSDGLLSVITGAADSLTEDNFDTRNYGLLDGIPEAKRLIAEILGVSPDKIIVGGNSSLNLMYDTIARAFVFGVVGSDVPWGKLERVKFLCPVPGYDRHFTVTESFGIEMINVPMLDDGPDMDMVEKLVAEDELIKGIWCIPVYSNPEGKVYSDEVVKRMAALKPKAKDFRIMWDNAYPVHFLEKGSNRILNIIDECEKASNPNMVLEFTSTSKITYPGGGIAAVAASAENIEYFKKHMFAQTIGPDKINQLRHVKFLKDLNGIMEHMEKHAEILRPKFAMVLSILKNELSGAGVAEWNEPKGGYFISVNVLSGCAKRVIALAKEAGVVLTPAGSTYPYKKDPKDENIRLAPTYPPVDELKIAMELFCICVKIAAAEKLLENK